MKKEFQTSPETLQAIATKRSKPLLCDPEGNIVDGLGFPKDEWRYLFDEMFEKNNVFAFFERRLATESTAGPAADRVMNFGPRRPLLDFFSIDRFYTVLPIIQLRMIPLAPDRRLAMILISEILPNYFPDRTHSFFLMDRNEKLVGFNHAFFQVFSHAYKTPNLLMGKTVAGLLSPTPSAFQRSRLSEMSADAMRGFETAFDSGKTGEAAIAEMEWIGGERRNGPGGGIAWSNSGQELAFVVLPHGFNPARTDLDVEFEAEVEQGFPPVFLLSTRKKPGALPDEDGFLLGLDGKGKGAVLKRNACILELSPESPGKNKFSGRYRFVKIGRSFFLYHGPRLLLAYYDAAAEFAPDSCVSLGLRKGERCLLKRVLFRARPSREGEDISLPENSIVELRTPEPRHGLLLRFYNTGINTNFPTVKGFLLQNVTDIQRRVDRLASDYEEEKKKGRDLEQRLDAYRVEDKGFVGSGMVSSTLKARAKIVAGSNAMVLIQGATGTGKEMLARYIHEQSPFHEGPFVKVDCSALPRELLESELFGHEKGAFTGAHERKIGLFERADHGTLFLDEVGNFSLDMQAKLLQFLQDFAVTRIGGQRPIKLELRVVAATNVPLEVLVKRGAFREDLYYRLFVVVIDMPLLKDRMEDLPDLCNHFLEAFARDYRKTAKGFSAGALRKIMAHDWPGNVRELRNTVQRAVLFSEGEEVTEELLEIGAAGLIPAPRSGGDFVKAGTPQPETGLLQRLSKFPDSRIREMLAGASGNILKLSKTLGVTRRTLYLQLRKRGIDISDFRKG